MNIDTKSKYDFDLQLVAQLCEQLGIECSLVEPEKLQMRFVCGATIEFANLPSTDAMIGCPDTGWHVHEVLPCSDPQGYGINIDYLNVVSGIADGSVLVCELYTNGSLITRSLVHKKYVDEFQYLDSGDEVKIRRLV